MLSKYGLGENRRLKITSIRFSQVLILNSMSFLSKLFKGNKQQENKTNNKNPDNTKLLFLLKNYSENRTNETYKVVMEELMNGDSFLLLPSDNSHKDTIDWQPIKAGTTIGLTSVYNLDGLKALAAFTDEDALINWSKKKIRYTALKSKDVLDLCQENKIERIVINSDQENMFVLERNKNITEHVIEKDTKVLIGTPKKPLSKKIISNLTLGFNRLGTVDEAFQYVQSTKKETSLVLAIKMNLKSDNSKAALFNMLNDVFSKESPEMPVDIMFVEEGNQLETIRSIENSLFYKN